MSKMCMKKKTHLWFPSENRDKNSLGITNSSRSFRDGSRWLETLGDVSFVKPATITARPPSVFKLSFRTIWKQLMAFHDEGKWKKRGKKCIRHIREKTVITAGIQSASSVNPLNFNPYVVHHANIQSAISSNALNGKQELFISLQTCPLGMRGEVRKRLRVGAGLLKAVGRKAIPIDKTSTQTPPPSLPH